MPHEPAPHAIFYDNLPPTPTPDRPDLVEVERIYCIDEHAFQGREWDAIGELYRSLPGGLRTDKNGCAMWFGTDEATPPFLWASAEPPGIQVYGVLSPADWAAWDAAFRTGLVSARIPFRDLA